MPSASRRPARARALPPAPTGANECRRCRRDRPPAPAAGAQQRDLAVRGGMLGQVVDDQQHISAARHELLGHRAGANGVSHCSPGAASASPTTKMQRSGAPYRRTASMTWRPTMLLPDRGIDADHVARTLVDDRINGDRGLAGAAVADDQFALAAAERDHRVDDEKPGRQRARHQCPVDDRRRRLLDRRVSRPRQVGRRRAAAERDPPRDRADRRRLGRAPPRPSRAPMLPAAIPAVSPSSTQPIACSPRSTARPRTPPSNTSSSSSRVSGSPVTVATPSPIWATRPTCSSRGSSPSSPIRSRLWPSQPCEIVSERWHRPRFPRASRPARSPGERRTAFGKCSSAPAIRPGSTSNSMADAVAQAL